MVCNESSNEPGPLEHFDTDDLATELLRRGDLGLVALFQQTTDGKGQLRLRTTEGVPNMYVHSFSHMIAAQMDFMMIAPLQQQPLGFSPEFQPPPDTEDPDDPTDD